MPAVVLTTASILACAHGGQTVAIHADARVTVSGAPVLCSGDAVMVSACPSPAPCVTLTLSGSSRVRASGHPLATGEAAPRSHVGDAGTVVLTQRRVHAA